MSDFKTPHQIYTDDDYYLLKSQYDKLLDEVNPNATGDWEYDLDITRQGIQKMNEYMVTLEDKVRELKQDISNWHDANVERDEALDMVDKLKEENQKLQSDEYIHQILYENMDDAIANQVEAEVQEQMEEYISSLNQVETSGDWYMSKLVSS